VRVFGGLRGPVVVGHRGGRGEDWPPENTLAAFERARAEGAGAVETDVRLCASGEVVAFHDPDLSRMTDGQDGRRVADVPLRDLLEVRLGTTDDRIPTLASLLEWARTHALPLNVEIKHDVPSRAALARAVARELSGCEVPVLLSSFDPLILAAMAVLSPSTPRALLTDPNQSYAHLLHAAARRPMLAALHVERAQAAPEAIARWKQRGLVVGVWTVNDPAEARRLVLAGVDLVITDCPAILAGALELDVPQEVSAPLTRRTRRGRPPSRPAGAG
jgi:glycerophosphoryl diester phosphodiesterase